MLEALPKEIILEILQYLNFKDLNNVSQASKSLFSMATYPSLWKNFDFRKCNNDDRQVPISSVLALPRFQKLEWFEVPSSSSFVEVICGGSGFGSELLPSKLAKKIAVLEKTEDSESKLAVLEKIEGGVDMEHKEEVNKIVGLELSF